jgi:hypothetical protein
MRRLHDQETVLDFYRVIDLGRDGIEVQPRSVWLITIRDSEQTSLTLYQTKQEALEAAGYGSSALRYRRD